MPTVLLYRDQLLPYSETFIPAQGQSLSRYRPVYSGTSRLVSGHCLEGPVVVFGEFSGRWWKGAYKLLGIPHPRWVKVLGSYQPTLVHAHFGGDGGLVLPLCQRLDLPLVVTFHGYDATWETPPWSGTMVHHRGDFFRALLLRKRDRALAKADCMIAVSRFIRDQLLVRGGAANKIVVHYIGIDRQRFQPCTDWVREPVVLFVGRLVEKKGVEYLLRAMAVVQRQLSTQLVIIGEGPLRSQLQTLADHLSVRAQFLGQQSPEQVRQWMNRAQVFCGPSIVAQSGDAEGFGMVFAEAQAMGLPVVSFATGGIPEAVIHGETGLLAPEKDTEQLTKYLRRLLGDSELRQRFAQAGQGHVAAHFDLQKNTRQLETIYDRVVERYRSTP